MVTKRVSLSCSIRRNSVTNHTAPSTNTAGRDSYSATLAAVSPCIRCTAASAIATASIAAMKIRSAALSRKKDPTTAATTSTRAPEGVQLPSPDEVIDHGRGDDGQHRPGEARRFACGCECCRQATEGDDEADPHGCRVAHDLADDGYDRAERGQRRERQHERALETYLGPASRRTMAGSPRLHDPRHRPWAPDS